MKSKFKISALTLLVAAGSLTVGLVSCGGNTSTTVAPTTPITSTNTTSAPVTGDHTVRFYDQRGDLLATVDVNDGEVIPTSSFPVIADDGAGHAFAGWYTNSGVFNATTPITGNVNLQARFYFKVSFQVGGDIIGTQDVVSGYAIDTTSIPNFNAPTHYTFDMWLNGSSEFLMTSAISRDITLTASFIYVLNGSGTAVAPFLLETIEDVYQFSNLVNLGEIHPTSGVAYSSGYYSLSNNITLTDDRAFTPINNFSGVFNGNGHTISNIEIVANSNSDIGFFATTFNATISNLKVNVTIGEGTNNVSGSNIGALIGDAVSTTITGVEVSGAIAVGMNKLARATVGGLVGYASNVTIDSCKITNAVIGGDIIGGVVGHLSNNSSITQTYVSSPLGNYRTANIGCFAGYSDSTSLVYNSWFDGGFFTSPVTPSDETSRSVYGLGTGDFNLVFTSDISSISTLPWSTDNWDLSGTEPVLKVVPETHEQITVSYVDGNAPAVTTDINYGDSFITSAGEANTSESTINVTGAYIITIDGVNYVYNSDYPLYCDVTLKSTSATYSEILDSSWAYSENESITIVEDSGSLTVSGQLPTATSSVSFSNVSATIGGVNKDYIIYSNGSYYFGNTSYNTGAVYFDITGTSYRVYIQRINSTVSDGTTSRTVSKGYLVFEEFVDNEWIMMTGQFNSPVIDTRNFTYYQANDNSSAFYLTAPYLTDSGDYANYAFTTDGEMYSYLLAYFYSGAKPFTGFTFADEDGNYVGEYILNGNSAISQIIKYARTSNETNIISSLPEYAPAADILLGTYVAEGLAFNQLQTSISTDTWGAGQTFVDYDLDGATYTIQKDSTGYVIVVGSNTFPATLVILNNGALGLRFSPTQGTNLYIAIYGDAAHGVSLLLVDGAGRTYALDSLDNYIGGYWVGGSVLEFEGNTTPNHDNLTIENQKINFGDAEITDFSYVFLVIGEAERDVNFAIRFEFNGGTYYITADYLDLIPLGINGGINLPILYSVDNGALLGQEYNIATILQRILASALQSYITADGNAYNLASETSVGMTRSAADRNTYIITYGTDPSPVNKIYYNINGTATLNGTTTALYGFDYITSTYSLTDSATFSYIDLSFEVVDGKYKLVIGDNSYDLSLFVVNESEYYLQTTIGGTTLYVVYQPVERGVFLCTLSGNGFTPQFGAIEKNQLDSLINDLQGHYSLVDSSGRIDITIDNLDLTFTADMGTDTEESEYTIFYDAINQFFFALTADNEPAFYVYKDGYELVYGYGNGSDANEVYFEPDGFYNFVGTWTAYSVDSTYTITISHSGLTVVGDNLNLTFSSIFFDYAQLTNGSFIPMIIGQAITDMSGLDSNYSGNATLTQIQVLYLDSIIYVVIGEFDVTLNRGRIVSVNSTTSVLDGVVFTNDTLSLFNGIYDIDGYENDQEFIITWQDGALYVTYITVAAGGGTTFTPVAITNYDYEVTETDEGTVLTITTAIDGHILEFAILLEADGDILYGYEWDPTAEPTTEPTL